MNDVSNALKTAYKTALGGGSVTLNSATVELYDKITNSTSYPYMLFGEFFDEENGDKTIFGHEPTLEVRCVTGYMGNAGGYTDSDSLANQVINIVRQRTGAYLSLASPFTIITTTVDATFSLPVQESGNYLVYERVVRFRHIIDQDE